MVASFDTLADSLLEDASLKVTRAKGMSDNIYSLKINSHPLEFRIAADLDLSGRLKYDGGIMASTITEKILAAHCGRDKVVPGEIVEARVDLALGNDITAPLAIAAFRKSGAKKVFDRRKVALVPSGAGKAFRSTFPFDDSGSAAKNMKADGTM